MIKKSNPHYHLLSLEESDSNTELFLLLEKNMQRLIKAGFKEYRCAVTEHGTISTKDVLNYYFDLLLMVNLHLEIVSVNAKDVITFMMY